MERGGNQTSHDLPCETARSFVGKMPKSLMRYGIVTIASVLLCLITILFFLPYKEFYKGIAIIPPIEKTEAAFMKVELLLRFEKKRVGGRVTRTMHLISKEDTIKGQLLLLFFDTISAQRAICFFKYSDLKRIENQEVDFFIVDSSCNLAQRILGGGSNVLTH